jgi:hypothetical protein
MIYLINSSNQTIDIIHIISVILSDQPSLHEEILQGEAYRCWEQWGYLKFDGELFGTHIYQNVTVLIDSMDIGKLQAKESVKFQSDSKLL